MEPVFTLRVARCPQPLQRINDRFLTVSGIDLGAESAGTDGRIRPMARIYLLNIPFDIQLVTWQSDDQERCND